MPVIASKTRAVAAGGCHSMVTMADASLWATGACTVMVCVFMVLRWVECHCLCDYAAMACMIVMCIYIVCYGL